LSQLQTLVLLKPQHQLARFCADNDPETSSVIEVRNIATNGATTAFSGAASNGSVFPLQRSRMESKSDVERHSVAQAAAERAIAATVIDRLGNESIIDHRSRAL